ncbi:Radical SAM superfamily enzyme, MoaA/NifB/PqqE/SkfB family [Clostridium cavendishii DSM 21758]|uniref:Radical SAM superfamily enzyme, MoaA/NifB/PqqE/SkfB family n=1 Tax=Clostridium cavendishii DSM 21758 TaxID=1121302 RepID=A0A1M6JEN7_9CLOT|nr:radical SAM protein [Clostridium cavendishii]SHJ45138.1 Radical SAM superfamily enzyme, MoaA/NifB/PqqE/SkfB family [Clostridium cavendishii DSM 21758]
MQVNKYYKYKEQKQAIFKTVNGDFYIITQFGKRIDVNLYEVLVYLFSNGQSDILKIQNLIKNNYKNCIISLDEIERILARFQKEEMMIFEKEVLELHPIYSFNSFKIVEKLDINCSKDTILTLGKLELAITEDCPFSCSYCMRKVDSENNVLSFEQKRKLVNDCFEMGAMSLNITGGEPLYGKYADESIELVKYAKKLGYKRIMISTSGYGVEKNIERLASSGLNELQISYNQCTLFEEDRVRNKFVEDNIDMIKKSMEYGIRLGVCSVLTKESLTKIEQIIEFCIKNKLYSVYFYPVMPVGGAITIWDSIKLNENDIRIAMEKIRCYKEKYKDKIYISAPQSFMNEKESLKQYCEGGTYMIYVSNKGEVSGCACSQPMSNTIHNRNIDDLWRFNEYFDKYRCIKEYSAPCLDCNSLLYCLNSCIIREQQAFKFNLRYGCNKCNARA